MKITSPKSHFSWLLPLLLTGCLSSPEYAENDANTDLDSGNQPSLGNDEGKITGIQESYDEAIITLGRSVYEAQCEACHGDENTDGQYGPMFVDGSVLTTNEAYVDYIRDFMPIAQTQACGQACAEAVMAYGVTHLLDEEMKGTDDSDSNGDDSNSNDSNDDQTGDQGTD